MKKIADLFASKEDTEVADVIHQVKISRTRDDNKTRLVIAMERGPERKQIVQCLLSIKDVSHMTGTAPANYLEEELSEWVSYLENK